jgi:predicted naringenin-chalcone synthase
MGWPLAVSFEVPSSYAKPTGVIVRAEPQRGEASLKRGARMPYPRIAAVATATPTQRFTQAELLGLAGYVDERRRGFFEASDIAGRHLFIDREHFRPDESVDELNDRFRRGALELGERAARAVLDRAGWTADEVDFLATTTCTGRLTPSLDAHLVARLGCRPGVQRVHVGDTGCAAAVVALQQAWNHLRAFPDHKAIVLAVEICSTAYFLDDRLESAVAHAIFADGAGAIALSGDGDGPAVVEHRTLFRSEHLPAMGFEYPGGRPRVVLSKEVRRIGAGMMKEMADLLMESQGLKKNDVRHFVLHSAGRRVIEQAKKLLDLTDDQLAHSRHVLRTFGNMSSATVVFVLEEALRAGSPRPGDWGLMIALGPGFAAEGALLRW